MPEEAVAVRQQIPENEDVQGEDGDDGPGKPSVDQFINFDGNEESGFANRQPASPPHPEDQAHALDE